MVLNNTKHHSTFDSRMAWSSLDNHCGFLARFQWFHRTLLSSLQWVLLGAKRVNAILKSPPRKGAGSSGAQVTMNPPVSQAWNHLTAYDMHWLDK
jgi:hypothetical protein